MKFKNYLREAFALTKELLQKQMLDMMGMGISIDTALKEIEKKYNIKLDVDSAGKILAFKEIGVGEEE